MKTETMQISIIIPSENYFLYNEKEKVISDKVFLGKESNAEDWQEITLEEKETLEKEWEKEFDKEGVNNE